MTYHAHTAPITNRFSRDSPVSMTQGRHGELIIAQGNGVRPARWSGEGEAVDAGMDAPTAAPSVSVNGPAKFYVARVDVTNPGACYYAPPAVSFKTGKSGSSTRPAKAAAYLSQAAVGEIRVLDGGKGYSTQPSIELSDTHGKGAVIEAELDEPPDNPTNSRKTGITTWRIVESGGGEFVAVSGVDYSITVNGNGQVRLGFGGWVRNSDPNPGYTCGLGGASGVTGYSNVLVASVTGWTKGTDATVRLSWRGGQLIAECTSLGRTQFFTGATGLSQAAPVRFGYGYDDNSKITITIAPVRGSGAIVIEGMTRGHPDNDEAPRYPVKALHLKSGGSGYLVAPQIKITSDSGFGAFATCKVQGGSVTEVLLENSGGGYKTPPNVEVVAGGAEAFAISRAHLRGKYQCYYRYVDATPEDKGGPIPSNLSPLKEIDAGEGAASASWSVAPPTGRATKAELWRSTSNQATTLYRVATLIATGSFSDSLTDDELRDPDRDGYAAMPIILPNGELNANRFGVPPSDKAVVVRFQDRHWYGVDTSGKQPNTIYYSEVDEPESVPESNEIVLQQNARDADRLRAMIPFGSTLLLMQERRTFSLTFAKNPILDAQVTPLAYRGCLNQRCWDIYGGACYVMDQYGIYAITPTGQIESISDQIANLFRNDIDFSAVKWSFLLVDAKTNTLRAFVPFREDSPSGFPTRALCYSLDTKAWWYEKYPQRITGGTQVRLSNGDFRCVYAGQSGPLLLNEGAADLGRGSVVTVTLVDGGSGYRTPPAVTATGGSGAIFQASINAEGAVTGIWITSPGYGYSGGELVISAPDDPATVDKRIARALYSATDRTSDVALFPTYRFKGGNAELITEDVDPKAASEMPRGVTLAYQPQPAECEVALRTYYNNSKTPRYNVASRNRGVGFTHTTVDAGARYDMSAPTVATGRDSGVATALFSGRTMSDIKSADRHISVELQGARTNDENVVFYGLEIAGTVGKEQP